MKKIFNIKITRNSKQCTRHISYFYYLSETFNKLHMTADKHIRIIFFINECELFLSVKLNDERINLKNYRYKIDKLMEATIYIRLNIVFAIERLS